jgi:hypothetical protein
MSDNQKLMDHMIDFTKFLFETTGEVVPMWLLQDAKGMIQPIVTPFGDDRSKDEVVKEIRRQIIELKSVRYGFMSEAWSLVVKKGHPDFDRAKDMRPSEHPDRREIVKLTVEDDQGSFMFGHFQILRPENGKAKLSPFKLNDEYDRIDGRFTSIFDAKKKAKKNQA